jgi:hypothetical protein
MLSCEANCYHVKAYGIMWGKMLSCGTKCYHVDEFLFHVEAYVSKKGYIFFMWNQVLFRGANVAM